MIRYDIYEMIWYTLQYDIMILYDTRYDIRYDIWYTTQYITVHSIYSICTQTTVIFSTTHRSKYTRTYTPICCTFLPIKTDKIISASVCLMFTFPPQPCEWTQMHYSSWWRFLGIESVSFFNASYSLWNV